MPNVTSLQSARKRQYAAGGGCVPGTARLLAGALRERIKIQNGVKFAIEDTDAFNRVSPAHLDNGEPTEGRQAAAGSNEAERSGNGSQRQRCLSQGALEQAGGEAIPFGPDHHEFSPANNVLRRKCCF
jgi:hypothetical protein